MRPSRRDAAELVFAIGLVALVLGMMAYLIVEAVRRLPAQ